MQAEVLHSDRGGSVARCTLLYEKHEYNFFRERREHGVGDAAHGRDEFLVEEGDEGCKGARYSVR